MTNQLTITFNAQQAQAVQAQAVQAMFWWAVANIAATALAPVALDWLGKKAGKTK